MTSGHDVPARVLVVWCPDWPVTATGLDAATPGAVVASAGAGAVAGAGAGAVAGAGAGAVVEACSAAARASGVRRGQRVRDAQRHCPGLVLRDRDPDAEGRLFESVAVAVANVTPWVEVVRPGVCAIPVHGAARYHGGSGGTAPAEEALRIHVQDTVVELGFDCGAGIADGLFAAELAARSGEGGTVVPAGETPGFLAPYPVSVLGRPELADLLGRLGIRTLGAFAALPVKDVTGRFGADEVRAHRLARGLYPRPPAPRTPPADLSVATEFDPPAAAAEQVVFAAKTLAERLHEVLAAEALTCVRLGVEVTGTDGRVLTRLWRHDGALSALAIAERVRWQLSSWETRREDEDEDEDTDEDTDGREYGQQGGIALLRLLPDQLVADDGRQETLWGEANEQVFGRVARAAARVQAMLGHQAITRPHPAGGRAPGERVVRVPFGDLPPEQAPEGPWPGRVPDPAPSTVHPEPLPAAVTDADGANVLVNERMAISAPPHQVEISGRRLAVTAWTGPWPARERWWDPATSRRRARFQVVTGDGGAHLLVFEAGRWSVEAGYA